MLQKKLERPSPPPNAVAIGPYDDATPTHEISPDFRDASHRILDRLIIATDNGRAYFVPPSLQVVRMSLQKRFIASSHISREVHDTAVFAFTGEQYEFGDEAFEPSFRQVQIDRTRHHARKDRRKAPLRDSAVSVTLWKEHRDIFSTAVFSAYKKSATWSKVTIAGERGMTDATDHWLADFETDPQELSELEAQKPGVKALLSGIAQTLMVLDTVSGSQLQTELPAVVVTPNTANFTPKNDPYK